MREKEQGGRISCSEYKAKNGSLPGTNLLEGEDFPFHPQAIHLISLCFPRTFPGTEFA